MGISLDERLKCAASLVPACRTAADIGCDHGRLSAYLLQSGRCERVIASDVSEVSRKRAGELFARLGFLDRVALSDKDGLDALTEPVGAVVIAGMGGKTIAKILSRKVNLQGAALILSPQTELPLARDAVYHKGYHIHAEYAVISKGRFYLVWDGRPGAGGMSDAQRALGVNLTDCTPGSARQYLLWQQEVAADWQGERGEAYRDYIREALTNAATHG